VADRVVLSPSQQRAPCSATWYSVTPVHRRHLVSNETGDVTRSKTTGTCLASAVQVYVAHLFCTSAVTAKACLRQNENCSYAKAIWASDGCQWYDAALEQIYGAQSVSDSHSSGRRTQRPSQRFTFITMHGHSRGNGARRRTCINACTANYLAPESKGDMTRTLGTWV
jgi:hypothetical protein